MFIFSGRNDLDQALAFLKQTDLVAHNISWDNEMASYMYGSYKYMYGSYKYMYGSYKLQDEAL